MHYRMIARALLICAAALSTACSAKPVTFSSICAAENDKKKVEVTGYLLNTGSSMCSKGHGHPWHCPISFAEAPTSTKTIRVNIPKGSGSSEIDAAGSAGLQIRDSGGAVVERSTKVRVTGKVSRYSTPGEQNCSMWISRIERL